MRGCDGRVMPFPGGIARSGSKVGSRYKALMASTNHPLCPTLRAAGRRHARCPRASASVFEIVIDGLAPERGARGDARRACTPRAAPARGRSPPATTAATSASTTSTSRSSARRDADARRCASRPPAPVDAAALRPDRLAGAERAPRSSASSCAARQPPRRRRRAVRRLRRRRRRTCASRATCARVDAPRRGDDRRPARRSTARAGTHVGARHARRRARRRGRRRRLGRRRDARRPPDRARLGRAPARRRLPGRARGHARRRDPRARRRRRGGGRRAAPRADRGRAAAPARPPGCARSPGRSSRSAALGAAAGRRDARVPAIVAMAAGDRCCRPTRAPASTARRSCACACAGCARSACP